MRLFRILFNPIATDGGGQGTPEPQPQAGSPERSQLSPPSSQGPRDFDFHDRPDFGAPTPTPAGNPSPQAQTGPGGQGFRTGQGNPAPVPTDPNLAPNSQAAAADTQAQWQSIRDAAAAIGHRFPEHIQDDRAALQHMVHQLQQRDYYSQLGQRLAPQANQIQQYLAQQQGQQGPGQFGSPQPPSPQRKAWEAPEFNQKWLGLVDQDPATGMWLSKAGAPAWVGEKVQAYADWKEQYDKNPVQHQMEAFREAAREEAQRLYQTEFQQQAVQRESQSIVQEISPWFYARGNDGQPVLDWQGQPQPSPAGMAYLRELQRAKAAGITRPTEQHRYAYQGLQYQAMMQQQRAAQQAAAAGNPGAQLGTHQANTNPIAGLSPQSRQNQPHNVEPDVEDDVYALRSEMLKQIRQAGITDADFRKQGVFEG